MDVAVHAQEDAEDVVAAVGLNVLVILKTVVSGDVLVLVEMVAAVKGAMVDVPAEQEAHVVAGVTVQDHVPMAVVAVLLAALVPVTTLALLIVWEIVKEPAVTLVVEIVAMTVAENALTPVVGPVVTHALGPVVIAATLGAHRPARRDVPLALFHVLKAA